MKNMLLSGLFILTFVGFATAIKAEMLGGDGWGFVKLSSIENLK